LGRLAGQGLAEGIAAKQLRAHAQPAAGKKRFGRDAHLRGAARVVGAGQRGVGGVDVG
jgi:hypothetical protein